MYVCISSAVRKSPPGKVPPGNIPPRKVPPRKSAPWGLELGLGFRGRNLSNPNRSLRFSTCHLLLPIE